jgi:hypothetical protein
MIKTTMNRNHQSEFSLLALALAAATATAQTKDGEKLAGAMTLSDEAPRNHFSAAFRAAFNLKPSFQNIGSFPEWIIRDPTLPQDRTYIDGYVRMDASGNNHAAPPYDRATWFWAYAEESTQTLPVPGSVLMHSDSSAPIASTKGDPDDPLPGFELTYNRQLGEIGKVRWGVEAAFGYMGFDFKDHGSHSAAVTRRADQYDFPALAGDPKAPGFPSDPYGGAGPGTFSGPGQLLGDTIMASQMNPNFGNALVTGQRRFEGSIFSGRLGPYLEIPITRRISFSFSGGLALVGVHSDFSYDESLTLPDMGTEGHSASGSHGDVLVGGYVSGSLSLALCSRVNIFVGGQFQSVGTYSHPLDNVGTLTHVQDHKSAKLDLNEAVFLTVGLTWSF